MPMMQKYLRGLGPRGFHKVAYTEWGAGAGKPTLVCVHGMTRNARDFDALAAAMEDRYRVASMDVVGRGMSDWLADYTGYGYAQYLADAAALLARLDVEAVDWVGTSMGGLMGMMLAARPNSPIRRLVLNDIGPFIPKSFLGRIRGYVGTDPHFADVDELEAHIRQIHASFGPLSDEEWRHLATHNARKLEDGGIGLAYDPGIAKAAFSPEEPSDVEMWDIWDQVKCPVLVLRGAESDLLLPETVERMKTSGPGCEAVDIPGCGHAPSLMPAGQIAIVRDWLAR
ncbi:MAG: alpha/beta hydrolase [Proteobacteria bacterium]|nr:alpha/beta hydrolase [Pseudomonadota bacterium]